MPRAVSMTGNASPGRRPHRDLAAVDALAAGDVGVDRLALARIDVERPRSNPRDSSGRDLEGVVVGAVGEQHLAVRQPRDDHRRRVDLGDGAEALGAGLDLGLGQLGARDVEGEAADHRDLALRVADREPDHHAPLIGVQARLVLLVEMGPPGGQHLAGGGAR